MSASVKMMDSLLLLRRVVRWTYTNVSKVYGLSIIRVIIAFMMKAGSISGTLVKFSQITRRDNSAGSRLHKLKFPSKFRFFYSSNLVQLKICGTFCM
jgi:hypothetical protein